MSARLARSLTLSLALLASASANALPMAKPLERSPAPTAPPKDIEGVGLVERLGERIPQDLQFTNGAGNPVLLRDLVSQGRPVVLTLVYYDCPMLCGLLLSGLTGGLRASGLELGRDYEAVTVSFNPNEKPALAAERQGHFLQALGVPERKADWQFLVGNEPQIHAIADGVGFKYRAVSGGEYAHIAAAYVLTPDGTISRYLYGVEFNPRDLKLAILEAGQGKVGTLSERILLTCYRWNPATRRYAFFVNAYLKAGGLLVLLGLGALAFKMIRVERARATPR